MPGVALELMKPLFERAKNISWSLTARPLLSKGLFFVIVVALLINGASYNTRYVRLVEVCAVRKQSLSSFACRVQLTTVGDGVSLIGTLRPVPRQQSELSGFGGGGYNTKSRFLRPYSKPIHIYQLIIVKVKFINH
jgi:hypothetical protein